MKSNFFISKHVRNWQHSQGGSHVQVQVRVGLWHGILHGDVK